MQSNADYTKLLKSYKINQIDYIQNKLTNTIIPERLEHIICVSSSDLKDSLD